MKWCKNLYLSDSAATKKQKMLYKLKHNKLQINCYVITLPLAEGVIMEIYPAYVFLQKLYKKQNICIIGLASDRAEAYELSGRIAADCYNATGSFDIAAFIRERQGGAS